MPDYPSNSRVKPTANNEEPEKKIVRVVEGEIIRQKKPMSRKIADFFTGNTKGVGSYIFFNILVPAAKDMISEAGSSGLDQVLYGDSRYSRRNRGRDRDRNYTNYDRMNRGRDRDRDRDRRRDDSRQNRGNRRPNFDEIIVATRVEAEEVLDRMFDLMERYDVVTVADFMGLVGENSNYVDHKWGWTDIKGANAERVRNGYLIDLPKPEELD